MDTLLLIYSKLKTVALMPWFAIAGTPVSLLSICGLLYPCNRLACWPCIRAGHH